MPETSLEYAQRQLALVRTLVEENAGLLSVNVNGTATSYANLLDQLDYWERKVARLSGSNPRVKRIKVGGF